MKGRWPAGPLRRRRGPAVPAPSAPAGGLSIWQPVHLGVDEAGTTLHMELAERNLLIGGEPGGGKSAALNLIVGHAALSVDCRLVLIDGKQVELGLWRDNAELFIGPDITGAITGLDVVRVEMDRRYAQLLAGKDRKIRAGVPGLEPIVVAVDEVAYYSATVGTKIQQTMFTALLRDLVARGRAAGIITIAATQRPTSEVVSPSLRDLFGYRWAFRCTTPASSDVILGNGYAKLGYSATDIDPAARGVGWLLAEGGIPRRVKAAFLTDTQTRELAAHAARLRAEHRLLPLAGGRANGEVA
jgi:S-DNA-T family DNA segregation ATPase FtsK/SpoIIIE